MVINIKKRVERRVIRGLYLFKKLQRKVTKKPIEPSQNYPLTQRLAFPSDGQNSTENSLDFAPPAKDHTFLIYREALARFYLKGEGIEIGALNMPLKVPESVRVKYVDRTPLDALHIHYAELKGQGFVQPDIIADGEKLSNIPDATQDFVIANHFLEHCQDPITAVGNMVRVLKGGGILYLAIPDKRYSPDHDRPLTTIEHLLRDHRDGPAWSKRAHFEEWVRLWPSEREKVKGEAAIAQRVDDLIEIDYSIHYHVWSEFEMMEFFIFLKKELNYDFNIEMVFKNEDEIIFILRRD